MPLEQGTKLSPFEILDALGAGGMGEVYSLRMTVPCREAARMRLRHQLI